MFKYSHIGISFSDEFMRFVKLSRRKGIFSLDHYEEKKLPPDAIMGGVLKNRKEITEAVRYLRQKFGVKFARVALPEEEKDIFEDSLGDWREIFSEAGIFPSSFEPAGQAIERAVIRKGDKGTYMIVDIGRHSTSVFVADEEKIVLSSALDAGGETLVRVAEKESIKKEFGLSRSIVIEEISSSMVGGITILREELSKIFMSWNNLRYKDGGRMPEIKKIILCGESAGMKGLDEFLAVSFKIKTELGDVWTNILDPREEIPEITFHESLSYAAALGAALK